MNENVGTDLSEENQLAIERDKIRKIDYQIFQLVSDRLAIVQKIGVIKRTAHLPIRDYSVEHNVLTRTKSFAKELDLSEKLATNLVSLLINEAITIQENSHNNTSKVNKTKKTLVIGGLGKMGNWMNEFFKASGYNVDIVDSSDQTNTSTLKTLPNDINSYELISICTPLNKLDTILTDIIALEPKGVIFDIGSLKSHILKEIQAGIEKGLRITSLHPMFGPNVRTLSGRNVILATCGSKVADEKLKLLFSKTACNLVEIPITDHDKYMSLSLSLSHAINLLFGLVLSKSGLNLCELNNFSSTTFLKQFRTASEVFSENPTLYYSIQKFNSHKNELYDALEQGIQEIKSFVDSGNSQEFQNFILNCRNYLGIQ